MYMRFDLFVGILAAKSLVPKQNLKKEAAGISTCGFCYERRRSISAEQGAIGVSRQYLTGPPKPDEFPTPMEKCLGVISVHSKVW